MNSFSEARKATRKPSMIMTIAKHASDDVVSMNEYHTYILSTPSINFLPIYGWVFYSMMIVKYFSFESLKVLWISTHNNLPPSNAGIGNRLKTASDNEIIAAKAM